MSKQQFWIEYVALCKRHKHFISYDGGYKATEVTADGESSLEFCVTDELDEGEIK